MYRGKKTKPKIHAHKHTYQNKTTHHIFQCNKKQVRGHEGPGQVRGVRQGGLEQDSGRSYGWESGSHPSSPLNFIPFTAFKLPILQHACNTSSSPRLPNASAADHTSMAASGPDVPLDPKLVMATGTLCGATWRAKLTHITKILKPWETLMSTSGILTSFYSLLNLKVPQLKPQN